MFTLIHALQAYLVASVFTKDSKLRLFSFIGGLFPDLDGITYLFDKELYYRYHREILHPPLAGLAIALLLFYSYEKKSENRKGTAAFFMLGFLTHVVADIFTTNWPVNLVAPLGTLYVSASPWLSYETIFGVIVPAVTATTVVLFAALVIKEQVLRRA